MTSDRTFFLKTRAARATVRRAPRGRLAPSPTGALHLGNARTFLLAWLSIRSRNGTLVLRMEDLDHPKVKPAAAQEALDDLRWLGLDWDEGPDVGGPYEPYVQSARIAGYRAALERLRALGRVYPCVCSRRDVENAQSAPQEGEDGLFYAGRCRGRFTDFATAAAALPAGRLPAWRFRAEPGPQSLQDGFCGRQTRDSAVETGDFVLARHADGAGYMLACVVDDDAMRIDEALRGADLLAAAHRQPNSRPPPRTCRWWWPKTDGAWPSGMATRVWPPCASAASRPPRLSACWPGGADGRRGARRCDRPTCSRATIWRPCVRRRPFWTPAFARCCDWSSQNIVSRPAITTRPGRSSLGRSR